MDAEKLISDILNKYYIPEDKSLVAEKLKEYPDEGEGGKSYYDECLEFAAIYWLKKRLKTATDEVLINKIMLQIVVSYLKLRDFVNAFCYMEMYIQGEYAEADKIRDCKCELEIALRRISDYIKEKNRNNIIIYLMDAVNYIDYPKLLF